MKILSSGLIKNKLWWVGKKAKCDQCFAVVELESADKVNDYTNKDPASIHFNCPECKKDLVLFAANFFPFTK